MIARKHFFATALCALTVVGCGSIPVTMNTSTTVRHADGTVEHHETHWHGTLDQLPAQMSKFGSELSATTAQLAKELTDVPPPGNVKLGDLSPRLKKFEGHHRTDFLMQAKDEQGQPITFQYVRLGIPSYDDFFRTAQEIYALVYQTTQTIGELRQLSGKILNAKVDASTELHGAVAQAEGSANADTELVGDLKQLEDVGNEVSVLVPDIAQKVQQLVTTGEALVTNAPASITNPKLVTHLDLIKTGVTNSAKVIKESGGLLVAFGKDLTGFGSSAHGEIDRDPSFVDAHGRLATFVLTRKRDSNDDTAT